MSGADRRGPARRRDLREIVALAWPVLVGQLAVIGFSTVDTVLVGRYARADLAALSVGSAAYITIFIGLMGAVLAIGPIVGQLFGAGRLQEAGQQLHQAVWMALALTAPGCAILLWPEPFMAVARAPAEVEDKARAYLVALAVALPAALLMQTYRGFNNAISRPKAVMALQLGALALKVPLSALFVFGVPALGWSPSGVVGCGVATAIVMWLQAGVALVVLRRDAHYARFALWGQGLRRPDPAALRKLGRLGLPMGLSILIEVSGFSLMAIFIARLGAEASAGHQIAANLAAILFMTPLALSNATMTLVAQRVGARAMADAARLARHGLELGTIVAALMAVGLALGRGPLVGLYTADQVVQAVAVPLLLWVALFHVADAVQAVASFVLRAFHVATVPMLIYAACLWGVGLGGGYVLAFDVGGQVPARWHGPVGYWAAAGLGLLIAAAALVAVLSYVLRQARAESGS